MTCYTLSQKRTYQNAMAKKIRTSAMKIRSSSIVQVSFRVMFISHCFY